MNFDNTDVISRNFTKHFTEIAIDTSAGTSEKLNILKNAKSVEIFTDLNWSKSHAMSRDGDILKAAVPLEATECKFYVDEKVNDTI